LQKVKEFSIQIFINNIYVYVDFSGWFLVWIIQYIYICTCWFIYRPVKLFMTVTIDDNFNFLFSVMQDCITNILGRDAYNRMFIWNITKERNYIRLAPHLNLLDHDSRWQISQLITVSITVRRIQNIGLAESTIEIT